MKNEGYSNPSAQNTRKFAASKTINCGMVRSFEGNESSEER
jgi:hypothetical protein